MRLHSGTIPFDVEARLLQELGERLVASSEVALLELIKNASDADATECKVFLGTYRGQPCLSIEDDGIGMSEQHFRDRWMRIATNAKREPLTTKFGRRVTGQKGIGRFAIRYLGAALKLESFYEDDQGNKTLLEAVFDWRRLDHAQMLSEAKVAYRVSRAPNNQRCGTRLQVWRLKEDIVSAVDKQLLTRVLKIASPTSAFDPGPFKIKPSRGKSQDPGYKVSFFGFPALDDSDADIAKGVLDHAWARLTISLNQHSLKYTVRFNGSTDEHELNIPYVNSLRRGLHADIAFTPRRKDAFVGAPILRNKVWDWLKDNSGIGIIDNGFRIRPYGFKDDDWLYLNQDGAHNRRTWRSSISEAHFPINTVEQARPKLNPALNLPTGYQLLGSVFVSSRASDQLDEQDLIPSMDREGFLDNRAYQQMVDIVRGGLEYLASIDKSRQLALEEREAEMARLAIRSDLSKTVEALQAVNAG